MAECKHTPGRIWCAPEGEYGQGFDAVQLRTWSDRQEYRDCHETQYVRADLLTTLEAEVSRLTALVDEAKVVVGPFADTADHDIGDDEADEDIFHPMTNHNSAMKITVGHMRAARAFAEKAGA